MPKENKTEVMQKLTSLFFHVDCLGTSQIASTDRYWVYPSAFSNRALNHPMMKQKTDHIESIKEFPIKFKLAKPIKYLTKKIKVKNQKTRCHVQPIQLNRN
ncbi:hypothetical protein ES288_D01G085600v1 [Gossypium darwinii]|uniref:Uncharacterized protein n=1 Tax=Gossypium darwinii TaxID=34276 RepID=A0A5D2DN01_GOSDA|nr:hypothetical protein ES288_D01G085600v1 [Gossypium darwinii]